MKQVWFGVTLSLVALTGCGDKGSTSSTGAAVPETKVIEVAAFKGGFGVDFYEKVAKEYETANPGMTVKVEGDPRIWEKLRPRFIGGTPPDLCFPGWGMDHWALKDEDQLLPLDKALAGKAAEGEGTWGDTFDPGLLKLGQMDGKQWVLPYYYSVLGWWYDPGVFKKNGWTPPKTWDELLVLGEKIKAAGMAPLTFQGKYPYYMLDGMLIPWINSVGGSEAIKACQNLEPGAWTSPAVLKAAQMIAELSKKGFFQRGAVGLSHTESQQQFLQGKAAMIPCGTWLKAEMGKDMPAGASMRFFLPPGVPGGKGDPNAVIIKIEPWMIPSKAKNTAGAIALFKQMTSLTNAKKFVEEKGTLMAIKGSDQAKLMPELEEPARVIRESKDVYAALFRDWYPTLGKEMEDSLTALLNGTLTPQEFCDKVEKKSQEVAADASIPKHKV